MRPKPFENIKEAQCLFFYAKVEENHTKFNYSHLPHFRYKWRILFTLIWAENIAIASYTNRDTVQCYTKNMQVFFTGLLFTVGVKKDWSSPIIDRDKDLRTDGSFSH